MKTIGILETGRSRSEKVLETYGDYPAMFEVLLRSHLPDTSFPAFQAFNGVLPDSHKDADAWIITGSRFCALDDHLWVHQLKDFVRKSYNDKIKLLGICFGHQIIAEALGGTVKASVGWGVGIHTYTIDTDSAPSMLKNSKTNMAMPVFHNDQVVGLPPDAERVGGSDFCHYGIVHYPGHAYTTQTHPEMTPEYIQVLIDRERGKSLTEEQAVDFQKTLDQPVDSDLFARSMVDFLND